MLPRIGRWPCPRTPGEGSHSVNAALRRVAEGSNGGAPGHPAPAPDPRVHDPHMTWASFRHPYTRRHRLRYCLKLSRIEMTVRMPSSICSEPVRREMAQERYVPGGEQVRVVS